MTNQRLLLGATLTYSGNPMQSAWEDAVKIDTQGGVLIENGRIAAVDKGTRCAPRIRRPR